MNLCVYKSFSIVLYVIHTNYIFSAEDWVQAINNPQLKIEEARLYCLSKVVYHCHFATDQYITPERWRLNWDAVPTLFLTLSDNSENCTSESEICKVVSSVRLVICEFA